MISLCDYCNGLYPTHTVTLTMRIITEAVSEAGSLQLDQGHEWAACDECARLVRGRDLDGLMERVGNAGFIEVVSKDRREHFLGMLHELYTEMFTCIGTVERDDEQDRIN